MEQSAQDRWLMVGVAIVLLVCGVIAVERAVQGSSDFGGFYRAMKPVLAQRQISGEPSVERYPPTFQTLHVGLLELPLPAAATVWTALNLAALAWTPFAIAWLSGIRVRDQALAWIAVAPFAIDNLVLGQSGLLLLAVVTTALALARQGRPTLGGGALALAAGFKVLPAIFLVVPMYLGRSWRAVGGAIMVGALLIVVTVAWYGPRETFTEFTEWALEVRATHTPYAMIEQGRSLRHNNQAVVITLARTLTALPAEVAPGGPRLATWPQPVVFGMAALITTVVTILWLMMFLDATGDQRGVTWLRLYAATAIFMLVVTPLVWTHYFIWLVPALVLLHRRPAWLVAFAVLSTTALASETMRFVGVHMWLSLGLLVLIWRHTDMPAARPEST